MAGCAPQVDAEITCQSAFDALAPIEPVDGLDMLISDDVAATVEHCESIQQWIDQFLSSIYHKPSMHLLIAL